MKLELADGKYSWGTSTGVFIHAFTVKDGQIVDIDNSKLALERYKMTLMFALTSGETSDQRKQAPYFLCRI